MSRARIVLIAAALALSACASGLSEARWTGAEGAQPHATAVAACQEISRGSADNFTICMAGRGWKRRGNGG